MAKVLAITNQKGGVGKTTTAVNLAACLGALGRRVLLVDFDPQGNATSGVGLDKTAQERTVYHVVIGGEDARSVIQHTDYDLDVLPANVDLAGAEVELATSEEGRETRLKAAVDTVRDDYDFILIDSPPSLGLLSLNALTAADGVLIPIRAGRAESRPGSGRRAADDVRRPHESQRTGGRRGAGVFQGKGV